MRPRAAAAHTHTQNPSSSIWGKRLVVLRGFEPSTSSSEESLTRVSMWDTADDSSDRWGRTRLLVFLVVNVPCSVRWRFLWWFLKLVLFWPSSQGGGGGGGGGGGSRASPIRAPRPAWGEETLFKPLLKTHFLQICFWCHLYLYCFSSSSLYHLLLSSVVFSIFVVLFDGVVLCFYLLSLPELPVSAALW